MSWYSLTELFFGEETDYRDHPAAQQDSQDLLSQRPQKDQKNASRTSAAGSWPEKAKPSFTQKLKYRSALMGEPAVFQCRLSAFPSPHITWFHNNRQIPQSLRRVMKMESCMDMHSSSLEVKEVQERDSGSYKVFAINSEGSAESTASLLVAHGVGQNAKYLEFLRKSEHTREHIESMVQKRRGERLKVDLRCIGSPFDKKQETEQVLTALSPGKGRVRTISFGKMPPVKREFVYNKDQVRNQGSVRQEGGKEAFLDEDIKLKLQRLREARKAKLEKKKICLAQESAEVQVVSLRNVGFGGRREVSHQACRASQVETKGSRFQTIEQINEKSVPPTMLYTKEMMRGSSSQGFEQASTFHTRMERILGLSGAPQIASGSAEKGNSEEVFQRQAFKGATKEQVAGQGSMESKRWKDDTHAQAESGQSRMEISFEFEEHTTDGLKTTKTVKKNPSPLVYVLLTEEVSEARRPEVVMSDTITLNVNEPAVVSEASVETAEERPMKIDKDLVAEMAKVEAEIKEPDADLESPLPSYPEPGPPFFIQDTESQEVSEGEPCVFNCDFQGYPHVTVIWYNNDKPLPLGHECTVHTTENHSTLTFSAVAHDQEGSVTCVVFNQHGTATTSGTLKVKIKAQPELEPCNICEIKLLSEYTEEEDELSVAFDHTKRDDVALSTTDKKATLLLPPVSFTKPCVSDRDLLSLPVEIKITAPTPTPEQDEELKEVIRSMEFVPDEAAEEQTSAGIKHKFKFSFDVGHELPKIIKEIQQRIRCREGDSVVLECLIFAEPPPIVTWLRNDEVLTPTENVCLEEENGIYKLCISKVSISETGTYKCTAENRAGVVETACDLCVDPVVEIFFSDTEPFDLKALQSEIKGFPKHTEKERFDHYFQSSAGHKESSFGDKACSENQQFRKDLTEKEINIPSGEMESPLPNYLNDIMRSLLADESESPVFQIQAQKELSKGMESKVEEQKVAIISGLDSPLINTLRDSLAKHEKVQVEVTDKCATTEITSSRFEIVTESHAEIGTSVTVEDTSSHDLEHEVRHRKDKVAVFEEIGKISKGLSFTELGSIISQSESRMSSGEERQDMLEAERQGVAQEHLGPDLERCQYEQTQSSSHEEIPSADIIETCLKEVKEETYIFEQEQSAKRSVDLSLPSPILKAIEDVNAFPQHVQSFPDMLIKHSQYVSSKEEASVSHLQSISDGFLDLSKTETFDLELRKEEDLQEVTKEQQDTFRTDQGQTPISDHEKDTLNHKENNSGFGEGVKERGIYGDEELIGKEAADTPELVFDLKSIVSPGDSVKKNIEEQIETAEPTDQYLTADAFATSLGYSNKEHIDKEPSKLTSEEVYAKESFVSDLTEGETNQMIDSVQKGTSVLNQDLHTGQPISDNSGATKQVQDAQEIIVAPERKEIDLSCTSFDTEMVAGKQKESVFVKDASRFEGADTDKTKLIENVEADANYEYKDIYKEREPVGAAKFDLKEVPPHNESAEDQIPKAPCLGSVREELNSATTQEISRQSRSFAEERIDIIGKKGTEHDYWVTESVEAGITKSAPKSESFLGESVHSDQGLSDVNVPIKEGINAVQPSIPPPNDRCDSKQTYTQAEEMYLKILNFASEDGTQNVMENVDKIIYSSQGDSSSMETTTGEDSLQECVSPENGDIHFKLPFLNVGNVSGEEENKLPQGDLSLKLLYSASEAMEGIQCEQPTSVPEISNDSQVFKESRDYKDGTTTEEKEWQTQQGTFDLKAHAASLAEGFMVKESETVRKEEECSFNLKYAFEMSLTKQLQSRGMLEEGISLSEELRQSYKNQVEGENSPEEELPTEEQLSVAQLLKKALENTAISVEEESPEKQHHEREGKLSEEEVLKMPDETFIWGQSESTPLSQYFQNVMKETGIPESGILSPEADSFISDLKKAVHGNTCQSAHEGEREEIRATEYSFVRELRISSPERNDSDELFQIPILPQEQSFVVQESSNISVKEPSLAQFLLSLKNESLASQEGEKADLSHLQEEEYSVPSLLKEQCEANELVDPSIGDLNEKVISETTLQTQELSVPPQKETEFSLTRYLLVAGEQEIPDVKDSSAKTLSREASITSLEVEDVTFSTVYDYYNQQKELARPLSPESEMSIDMESMSGDEMMEAERFYTPTSSVENFESPMSFTSYHTPVGSPERYSTPSEERYSTPSENRYSTPSEERYSTPSEERYSTPSEEQNRDSRFSPTHLVRGNTPSERYQIPTGPLLQQRSFSLEELRAEMFGTPCEALEPKGNEMPPAFLQPLTKRKLYENSTLRFIVEVIGSPVPGVKWYRNRSLLEQDERLKIQKEGDICILEMQNIQKADGGEYMCHAINTIGEAKSITQVEVLPHDGRGLALPPPVTHQHVIEFEVEPGSASRTPSPQEILLEVELDEADIKECEKQVKIATLPELASDNQSMIVSLDVLPLSLVEHAMELPGKGNRDVQIDFEVTEMPPRFTTPTSDIEIQERSEASFHCKVQGCPAPVVQWFKESKFISPDGLKYAVAHESGGHSLTVQDVGYSDSGMYICKAVNTVGEAICRCFLAVTECQRSLAVGGDGGVSSESSPGRPQKIDLLVDSAIRNGSQTEIELEFEFEGDTDDSQKAVRLVAVTEQEQEEEGESCVNINFDVFAEPSKEEKIEFKAESTDSCSFEFQVTESPPKFAKDISDCASFVGTSACFQGQVVGSPKPAISWFTKGLLISGERFHMEESQEGCHSLVVRNVDQNDEGEYKCVATNKAGTAHCTAFLIIL